MSISGLTQSYMPPTLDGLNVIDADQIYINGQEVDLNNLVPYTGANKTLNMGSQNIQTTYTATASNDVVNLTVLQNAIAYTEGIVATNFLNKLTTTPQTVAGYVTFNGGIEATQNSRFNDLTMMTSDGLVQGWNTTVSGTPAGGPYDMTINNIQTSNTIVFRDTGKIECKGYVDTNATANKVAIFNADKELTSSGVDSIKITYLDNVSSDIQTQLNGKVGTSGNWSMSGDLSMTGSAKITQSYNATTGDTTTLVNRQTLDSAIAGLGAGILNLNNTWTGTNAFYNTLTIASVQFNQTFSNSWTLVQGSSFNVLGGNTSVIVYNNVAQSTSILQSPTQFWVIGQTIRFSITCTTSFGPFTFTIRDGLGNQLFTQAGLTSPATLTGTITPLFSDQIQLKADTNGAGIGVSITYSAFSISPNNVAVNSGADITMSAVGSLQCRNIQGGVNFGITPTTVRPSNCSFYGGTYDNTASAVGGYADCILMNTYASGTFGGANLLMLGKNAIKARLYQGTYGSVSAMTSYKNLILSDTNSDNVSLGGNLLVSGNVGIGTNNATRKLTVYTGNDFGLSHTNGTIEVASFVGGSMTAGWYGTVSNHPLAFYTNNSSAQVVLKTNGNLGIGSTDPQTKLDVVGGINATTSISAGTTISAVGQISAGRWGRQNDYRAGMTPNNQAGNTFGVHFGTFSNDNITPFADLLCLNTWSDSSGGSVNCLAINKGGKGIRQYRGTFASTSAFSTYHDCVMTEANSPDVYFGNNIVVPNRLGVGTYSPTGLIQISKAVSANNDYSLMLYYENTQTGYYDWQIGPFVDAGSAMFAIRGGADGFGSIRTLYKFDTNGNFRLIGEASTGGGKVEFYQPDGTRLGYVGFPNSVSSTAYFWVEASRHLSIATNSVERIWIKSNGKIAMGMDTGLSPTIGLGSGHIVMAVGQGIWNSSTYNDGANVNITDNATGPNCNALALGQNFANDYAYISSLTPGVVWRQLVIASSYTGFCSYGVQTAYNGPGGIVSTSDERCKEDIQPLNTAKSLKKILQSKPVHYRIKFEDQVQSIPDDVKSRRCIGLVAQDQLEVNPHCVSTWKKKDCEASDEDDGTRLGICYNDINIHTVGAIQELYKQIETLQTTVDSLVERDKVIVEHAKQVENQLNTLRTEFEDYKIKTEERMNKLVALFLSSKENGSAL